MKIVDRNLSNTQEVGTGDSFSEVGLGIDVEALERARQEIAPASGDGHLVELTPNIADGLNQDDLHGVRDDLLISCVSPRRPHDESPLFDRTLLNQAVDRDAEAILQGYEIGLTPGEEISGDQMRRLIRRVTQDQDSNAAAGEYKAIADFVGRNIGALSPEALKVFADYKELASEAQRRGETGLDPSKLDRILQVARSSVLLPRIPTPLEPAMPNRWTGDELISPVYIEPERAPHPGQRNNLWKEYLDGLTIGSLTSETRSEREHPEKDEDQE